MKVFRSSLSFFGGVARKFWNFLKLPWLKIGGFLIIFYTIFMRFIRPRATGPIDVTYTEIKFYLYICLIIAFSLSFILVITAPLYLYYLRNLKKTKVEEDTTTYFYKLKHYLIIRSIKIHNIYEKMLEASYAPIFHKYSGNMPPLWGKILKFITFNRYTRLFINIFYFIPPCLISLTYFIEVVVYHHFTYFPFVIFLMIFPLGIRVFVYTTRLFCDKVEEIVGENVKIEQILDNGQLVYTWSDHSKIEEQYRSEELLYIFATELQFISGIQQYLTLFRSMLYLCPERTFYNLFSISCWLTSFITLLYLITH